MVPIIYSSIVTIQDEEDSRWYALRFPPGGSGYVIDSALFSRFHGVRAGPTIQQSVLAVFNKQDSNLQMVRERLARMATGETSGFATHQCPYFSQICRPWLLLTSMAWKRSSCLLHQISSPLSWTMLACPIGCVIHFLPFSFLRVL